MEKATPFPTQMAVRRKTNTSPAMAAGVSTRLFDVMDLVNLLVESETKAA